MPAKNPDLHGNVPDKSNAALLIIDVINDLEWEGGERILPYALEMARAIDALRARTEEAGIPTIFVNDNFGRWRSEFTTVVEHVRNDDTRGRPLVEILHPVRDDYFVLKPKHSGFFSSTLDTLLEYLQVSTLILTGIQTNICVLFTANDAYMRDFRLFVPRDCCVSERLEDHENAMQQMCSVLKADIRTSTELNVQELLQPVSTPQHPGGEQS